MSNDLKKCGKLIKSRFGGMIRGIKIVGGEILRTLGIRIKKMTEDLALDTEREQLGRCQYRYYTCIYSSFKENDKADVLTYHKKLRGRSEKEKEELKAKVEKWQNSSKNLNILLNSQMSARDKVGLGYGDQMNKGVLSYENEVFPKRVCLHLIRDCDFHEKRMAKQDELKNRMSKGSASGQAVPINAARKVNTVKPIVNNTRPKAGFHKSVSPFRKSFNSTTALRTNFSKQKVNTAEVNAVSAVKGKRETADYPHRALQNKGIVDSGCSRHMTGNKAYLAEYQDFNGGPVAFGGSKGYITGKGKIKTGKLDFEDVCFVKELQHFNLFSVSQICDKKNKVLFTDSECLVLSPEFKLPDENQVLLRIPRQNNMYSFNLENIVPSGGLACLIAKATIDESNKWHRRLGHVNFKNLNKLVKGNLVRGLPSKIFQNDHTCVACQKGKQHKASCKAKTVSSISQPLQLLHMDLFGPTSVRSLNHKTYCLVITDDFSREYSNARTPQQNGVVERKNRTLIKAARTMLADSFLPNTFWAEAVSTACYVLNRVLVTKPQNKTPYELITGKIPIISYIRPFGCHVTILNTIDHLGKFDGKSDEGFLVGYSLQSKAFRVYNLETKRVEENLHITFLENKPNVAGKGPTWLFDLDYLTDSMNYQPVRSENQANKHAGPQEANHNAGTKDNINAGDSEIEAKSAQDHFVLPIWSSYTSTVKSSKANNAGEEPTKHPDLKPVDKEDQVFLDELERLKRQEQDANDAAEALRKEFAQDTEDLLLQAGAAKASSTNLVNTASTPVSTASPYGGLSFTDLTNTDQDDSEIPALEEIYDNPTAGIFTNASYDDEGAVADFTNLETVVNVSPIPTSRINSIHPSTLILGDPKSAVQTRSKVTKSSGAYAFKISEALEDESWVDAMQEELLQFKIQKVWILVDLPYKKKTIGTEWVYRNKKDEKASRPDIMYLKGKPKLGLWYPRVSSFDLEANSNSDYAGANLDRKSTTRGCQFLGRRVISWQCKKQTIVATSTTEAEYVAAANCCGQVLWIQNQMLDYGFNFMNTKIYIDNESIICIINNPVYHSKTKHIAIRHHFIMDAYEKKLI
ncbi:putative ribonuclease H-like domain-containing protein [Tanacetum coccineum]